MATNILLETGTNELEIVEFYIEKAQGVKEYYGINVIKVQEIIRYPEVTKIPARPHPCFLGLIRLREEVIPLLDLGIYLYNTPLDSSGKVIVTEFNRMKVAFLVSGLTRIHRISWENVSPPVDIDYEGKTPCITGVVKFDSRIIFTLDVEKIVAEMVPIFLEEGIITHEQAQKKYKVLIADDSPTVRNMLIDHLKGFDIHTAKNGKEAWEYLVNLKQGEGDILTRCNLVITDIEMPQMDGFTLTKKIKEDPVLNKIPVILFSSVITDTIRHKGQSVGADDQISKPELVELAKRALQLIEKANN